MDKIEKIRSACKPTKKLCALVKNRIEARKARQVPALIEEHQPELNVRIRKLIPRGSYPLDVLIKLFDLHWFCPVCQNETNIRKGKPITCSKECTKVAVGASISASRQRETAEQLAARTAKIKASKKKAFGENWTMVISARTEATKAKMSPEQKRAVFTKAMDTLAKKLGVDKINSVYDVPGLREQMTKSHKAAIPRMLKNKEKTMMERYGVRHQAHTAEFHENRFDKKTLRLGGKSYTYQGFEAHVLRALHKANFVFATSCPGIPYTKDGEDRMYFPDIHARHGKRRFVIEVKSTYTFKWTRTNMIEKFFAGTQWCKARGADYVIVVVHPKTGKAAFFTNPVLGSDLAIKEAVYSSCLENSFSKMAGAR